MSRRAVTLLFDVVALLLIAVAAREAARAVAGLEWPCEEDFYRDMGFVRTIMDGRYGQDPFFLGEDVWYNPLVHAVVAVAALVTGAAPNVVYSQQGVILNLITPIAFYALAARAFGRRAGLFALVSFLFFGNTARVSWLDNATYSPWMWPENFAQGLFFVTLLIALEATRTRMNSVWALAGVLLGTTLLAQNAPFVVASVIIAGLLLSTLVRAVVDKDRSVLKGSAKTFATVFGVAFVVSLPFTAYLLGYGLDAKNHGGIHWTAEILRLENLGPFLGEQLRPRVFVALLGLVLCGLPRLDDEEAPHRSRQRVLVFWWLLVTAGYVGYSFVVQKARASGVRLPGFVPGWHFLIYLRALESVLVGVAVDRSIFALKKKWSALGSDRVLVPVTLAIVGVSVFLGYGGFRERADFVANRKDAELLASKSEYPALQSWILENTKPDDVFVTSIRLGVFAVAPTGRKIVLMPPEFSNPFVDYNERKKANREMVSALTESSRQYDEFSKLAKKYDVDYVLFEPGWNDEDFDPPLERLFVAGAPFLEPVFTFLRRSPSGRRPAPGMPHEMCPWGDFECEPTPGTISVYRVNRPAP